MGTAEHTLLRLATAGSVDDGKSTLVGRLLHDCKAILADQIAHVKTVSEARGGDFDFALLTDGLRAEREQGITIDVAYRYFATDKRSFILADCPGHVQYTRNTVTGASTADVVIILVDARHGVLEQTRRHLAVAGLLRVPHVVLAVNKIDLVNYDEAVYTGIAKEVGQLADQLGIADLRAIPVSALVGDNIVTPSTATAWYDGPTLLDVLENANGRTDTSAQPLRFPVQYVIRPQTDDEYRDYRGYSGTVASGTVNVGDPVIVLPAGRRTSIAGIDRPVVSATATAVAERPTAVAGEAVTVRLADDIDVARGSVIVAAESSPGTRRELSATVCWLSDRPLTVGARLLIKHTTTTAQAIVTKIAGVLDLATLGVIDAAGLDLNDIGKVQLKIAAPLAADPYSSNNITGSFLLIDAHDGWTLAAGMIDDEEGELL
ncbi:sulfate adenylyltransferase [Kribbella sandramycini]|uniref:sulfate adenylyltransferase n=1 Tax=Kribbella sandramycini TaxID=60450 RepID=A0A7Y4P0G6_9ACTN|nr:GTP-binding protein [Kribbella sandramycini]MBB6569113.1 sulfate adenylyltransferase subunit 1 [Kribbella sandramycini]NOL41044.1 sulfate adenylyltransferase [Kribbella sandramycini]